MELKSQTKKTKRGYWSEPYFDEGAGNIIMSTYAVPIFDKNNNVVAIYTTDISLINYTDMVEHMLPFPDSYSFMISRSGLYITHRLNERILNETIFANAYANNNLDYESIGTAMTNGEKGYYLFDNDGFKSYAIFVPLENTWLSLCSVCKQDILISELQSFSYYIILIFIIGIALFYITIYLTIRHLTKPLDGFVHSATKIAHGDFNVKLPKIQSKDEMKGLRDSFDYMQKSLKKYIFELKETTATKERIESELSIAHDIQMGMIPKIFPPYPNRSDMNIFEILDPAKEVGGDLYDFFISNEKLYFAIGDVSGKGVPASLFMAISRSLFRTISNQTDSPKEIIGRMNSSISDQNESCMFITMFIGVLDLKQGILNYCNACHNPPIIINNNEPAKYIEVKRNIPIGIMSDYIFTEEQIKINLNTKLICYTDGIIEAENNLQELYTDNNLFSLLDRNYKLPPKKLTNLILDDVRLHVNGAAQSDDLTLMIIEYK